MTSISTLLKQKLVILQKICTHSKLSTHTYLIVYILRVFLQSALTTSRPSTRRIQPWIVPIGCHGPPSPHKPIAIGHSGIVIRDGPCVDRRNSCCLAMQPPYRLTCMLSPTSLPVLKRGILASNVSGPAHHLCGGVKVLGCVGLVMVSRFGMAGCLGIPRTSSDDESALDDSRNAVYIVFCHSVTRVGHRGSNIRRWGGSTLCDWTAAAGHIVPCDSWAKVSSE
jgi:hypothetical protein